MPTPFEPGNHVLNTFSTVTSNACRKPPQRGCVQFIASLARCYLWFRTCNRAAILPRRTPSSTGPDKNSWAQSREPLGSGLDVIGTSRPGAVLVISTIPEKQIECCCFALLLSFHLVPRPSSFKCHMRTVGGRITRWSPVRRRPT